jgi:DNA invertase Pin-like site-specific DNA recombinase
MKKVALYARVSTADQHSGLESQIRALRDHCDKNGILEYELFTVIAAIGQLERELIVERVKNGLRNAKLKGKQIGRMKTRNSELIRSLLNSGMTLRKAAVVAGCSHGSVSLERALMRKEKVEAQKIAKEQAVKVLQLTHQTQPAKSSEFTPSVF